MTSKESIFAVLERVEAMELQSNSESQGSSSHIQTTVDIRETPGKAKRRFSEVTEGSLSDLVVISTAPVQREDVHVELSKEQYQRAALGIQLEASNHYVSQILDLWTVIRASIPEFPHLPPPKLLHSASDSSTNEFIQTVRKVTEKDSNKPALRTWDKKHVLHWSILQDMLSTVTTWTIDSVLDSWFSIIFSFAFSQDRESCKVATLSSIVSTIPSLSKNAITMLIPTCFNDLYCFNYWHLLDFLYFPLNINGDHWILIRVGIQTKILEVFDSTGVMLEDNIQKQLLFFLIQLQLASWEDAKKKKLVSQDAQPLLIKSWTFKQPKKNHPKQGENSLDCAYFVMQTAYLLLKGQELNYHQEDMLDIKRQMVSIMLANMELVG
ncbi:hypothetical protein L873DRAFT_1843179 [Choiromyces venosus 120613-1]|uniref:Ubiquitin-like protease family profile domain-containing protein n=1 Tax=Choiromyces venosus 120613-1 TaxID=1336337 RepID=A0A3N4JSM2_9PEZI|nr:hypothetical protein L873DRAFT_1843179 [Choiromyces venosus 120613-1]